MEGTCKGNLNGREQNPLLAKICILRSLPEQLEKIILSPFRKQP